MDVDEGLVDESDDLDVIWCFHKLDTFEGAGWDEAGAAAWFCAPGDFLAFCVGDEGVGVFWCPEAEIWNVGRLEWEEENVGDVGG